MFMPWWSVADSSTIIDLVGDKTQEEPEDPPEGGCFDAI
jgi:hypothetical protein